MSKTETALDTFPKLSLHNGRSYPTETAMREKQFGIWVSFTWGQVLERTEAFTLGLADLGVTKGSVVGLIGDNRPDWVMGEGRGPYAGGDEPGIYRDAMEDEVAYLVNYADIEVMICEDEEQIDKVISLGDRIPSVKHIIYADPRGMRKYDDPRLVPLSVLLENGERADRAEPSRFESLVAATETEAVAVLCTTRYDLEPEAGDADLRPRWSGTRIPTCRSIRKARRTITSRSRCCPGSWSRSMPWRNGWSAAWWSISSKSRKLKWPICAKSARPSRCSPRASGNRSPVMCAPRLWMRAR